MHVNQSDSDDTNKQSASVAQRLDQIERVVSGIAERLDHFQSVVKQLFLFAWIVGVHSIVVATLLYFGMRRNGSDIVTVAIYGLSIGSATTIAVWQGISMRSFWGRWARTLIATTAVLISMGVVNGADIVVEVIPLLLVYFSSIVVCTRVLAGYSHTWLWAPDLPMPAHKPITIAYFLLISLAMALLISFCRYVATPGSSFSISLMTANFLFGIAQGLLISVFLAWFVRLQSTKSRCLVVLLLLALNTDISLLAIYAASFAPTEFGIAEESELGRLTGPDYLVAFLASYLPSCIAFSCSSLVSPALTLFALLLNGQKLVLMARGSHLPDATVKD